VDERKIPENVELAIKEFVEACKEKFKENLVSIVLFGSYVRGNFKETSDVDLLVIFKKLPESVWERDKMMEEILWKILLEKHVRVSPIIVEPEEIKMHAKWPNPLFYGILLGYHTLLGSKFFEDIISLVKERIRVKDPLYVEGNKEWRLIKLI
jgi:predicted nucleotidyltransferase